MGACLGLGAVETTTDARWERRCEGMLRQLPVVSVALAAVAVAMTNSLPPALDWIRLTAQASFCAILVLAMLRQGTLLKEHDALRQAQGALLLSQHQLNNERGLLQTLIKTLPDLVWLKDPQGRYLSCNTEFERLFGWRSQGVIGKTDFEVFDAELANTLQRADQKAMASDHPITTESWASPFTDGVPRLFEVTKTRAIGPGGQLIGVVGVARDITQKRQAQQALQIAAVTFESQLPMMVTDARSVILNVNQAFTDSTGYTAAEVVGRTPRMLASGRHNEAFYEAMWQTIAQTGVWQGEVWDKRKNGEVYPKWLSVSAVKNSQGEVTHYVGTHLDITERKAAEAQINALAFYDQLTSLPNRTLLLDRIAQAMAMGERDGSHASLLFMDLDHFKTINDTHGHSAGDALLKQVATRLSQGVRAQDTVARLGGDEFVVMLLGLDPQATEAASQAEAIASALLHLLGQPYALGDLRHRSTASVGVSLFRGRELAVDEVMRQADLALYRAKSDGRNTVRFFDQAMEAAVLQRATLEADLRQAVEEGQFELHYQAQVDAKQHVVGAEALVRWLHPQRGMVSPTDFIPMAEETGLILPLGLWVLNTACTQLAAWARQPHWAHLSVSVNVSAHQFQQRDFVSQVLGVLDRTGAPPQRLKLELTESMLVSDVDNIIQKMHELKAHGVGFSLDDFGTGFSSLTYLKRLPLDELKIDQSFVRDVLDNTHDEAIARTIVSLSGSLGLSVVAEGVETLAQRQLLLGIGCRLFQGYLFARPQPVDVFEAWLTQGSTTHTPCPMPETKP
jgi:diguanylate cyclase (GGDEF)-like protein/PAS domain S-box-containing protein